MSFPFISSICLVLTFSVYCARNDTAYNTDGTIRQITQFNAKGLEHGKKWGFNQQGGKVLECEFKDGMYHGQSLIWYDNGKLKSRGFSKNDKMHGWHCRWDSLGYPVDSSYFDMGKRIEHFTFYPESRKVFKHLYYYYPPPGPGPADTVFWMKGVETGKRRLVMEDQFNSKGELISQIRNGNGIEYDIRMNDKYEGFKVYKKGVSDYNDYMGIEWNPKDPRHKRVPIPKSKRIPWDVKKYGKVNVPVKIE